MVAAGKMLLLPLEAAYMYSIMATKLNTGRRHQFIANR
jgi:hypothetical protein